MQTPSHIIVVGDILLEVIYWHLLYGVMTKHVYISTVL